MSKFTIDFFEFSFLVEACIPPRPIARSMFFYKVINEYYDLMQKDEKKELFNWIKPKLDLQNEDCQHFFARFNPENQYLVYTEFEGRKDCKTAYLFEDVYHLTISKTINPEYIYKVEKIEN